MTADNPIPKARVGGPGRHRQRGVAIVEFALIFPFLLVLTMCVIDVSRAFWVKNVATQAAREAARYIVVHTMADVDEAQARAQTIVASANVTMSVCDVVVDPDDPEGRLRKVTVGCDFDWLFPGLFNWLGANYTNPVTITAVTVMRSET